MYTGGSTLKRRQEPILSCSTFPLYFLAFPLFPLACSALLLRHFFQEGDCFFFFFLYYDRKALRSRQRAEGGGRRRRKCLWGGFKPLPNSSPAQPVGLQQCRLLSYFNEGFCPKNAAATQWIHNAVVYTFT